MKEIETKRSLQSKNNTCITPRGHSSELIDNTTLPDYMALSPSTRSWEVPRNKITIDKVIGKGSVGQVAKGTAEDLSGKKKKTTVAIKMLVRILVAFSFVLPSVAIKLILLLNQLR